MHGHSSLSIFAAHTPLQDTLQAGLIGGIDDHPGPVEAGVNDRHLHHRHSLKSLQLALDRAEYVRVGQVLQCTELARISENNASQPPPIDHAIAHDLRPSPSDRSEGLARRLEHPMAHSICIDNPDACGGKKPANLTLSRADPA